MSESCDVSRLLKEHQAGVLRYVQAKGCSKLGVFEEQARMFPCPKWSYEMRPHPGMTET